MLPWEMGRDRVSMLKGGPRTNRGQPVSVDEAGSLEGNRSTLKGVQLRVRCSSFHLGLRTGTWSLIYGIRFSEFRSVLNLQTVSLVPVPKSGGVRGLAGRGVVNSREWRR